MIYARKIKLGYRRLECDAKNRSVELKNPDFKSFGERTKLR